MDEINEPAPTVETSSGHLYRIPQEALLKGSSPVIMVCDFGARCSARRRA